MGSKRLLVAAAVAGAFVPLAQSAQRSPERQVFRFAAAAISPQVGSTVLLAQQTKTAHCKLGAKPDRACSPGAYYSRLTKRTICSASFHTSDVRNVTDGTKHQVEIEYGLAPKGYGSSLEIDHIVSLELGGSNDPANLFPELAPGYHVKDQLENKVHDAVCSGGMRLRDAQRAIATDWQKLYRKVFGSAPGL